MPSPSATKVIRATMLFCFAGLSSTALVFAQWTGADGKPGQQSKHLDSLLALNKKFEGAGTCGGSACHGGGTLTTPPTKIGSEQSVWQAKDDHAKAATNITKPDLKRNPWMADIAKKLGLDAKTPAELLTNAACVSCHGSPVPKALQGEKFSQSEGVSCYQCHGPSEAWRGPHQKKGWTEEQRKAAGGDHEKLLAQWGLFDTKPPVARAEMCASCHLALDEKVVAAGHPQPIYEQLTFQNEEPEHWIEQNLGYGRLNLYAAGQVVSMREAMAQLAAQPANQSAYDQAAVHARLVSMLVDAKAIPGADAAAAKALVDAIEKGKGDAAAMTKANADVESLAKSLLAGIAKAPTAGDQAAVRAMVTAVSTPEAAAAFAAHGRRGVEQAYFAVDRLSLAYREGAKIPTADFKAVRDALKPLRDLKIFENRNLATPPTKELAALPTTLKAFAEQMAKVK